MAIGGQLHVLATLLQIPNEHKTQCTQSSSQYFWRKEKSLFCVCVVVVVVVGGRTKPWTVWMAYRKNDNINNTLLLKDNTFCLLKCLNSDWRYLWWTKMWWNYDTQNKMYMIRAALHKDRQWFKAQTEAIYIILYEHITAYLFISTQKLLNCLSSLDGNIVHYRFW